MCVGLSHGHTSQDQAPVSRHIPVVFASNAGAVYPSQQSAAFSWVQWRGVTSAVGPDIGAESTRRPQHSQRWRVRTVSERVTRQWLLFRKRTCIIAVIIPNSITGTNTSDRSGGVAGAKCCGVTGKCDGLRFGRLRAAEDGASRLTPV